MLNLIRHLLDLHILERTRGRVVGRTHLTGVQLVRRLGSRWRVDRMSISRGVRGVVLRGVYKFRVCPSSFFPPSSSILHPPSPLLPSPIPPSPSPSLLAYTYPLTLITGRFKKPYDADSVLFGNTFDRPLNLPWGSGAALKFMQ